MGAVVGFVVPIESIRRYQMSALLDDLHALEGEGLVKEDCDLVKAALASVASAAAEIPDGSFWSGTILGEAERVYDAYEKWNGVEGTDRKVAIGRKSALRKLRRTRQRLARRIHLNQYVLQTELDKKLVADMYNAFGKIVENAPTIFNELSKSIAESKK